MRRAGALDGKEVAIMETPFWRDKRRVQIQSLEDPDLTLGVKPRYLELARSHVVQSTNDSLSSRTDFSDEQTSSVHAVDEIQVNQSSTESHHDIHVDIFVERRDFTTRLDDHQKSEEYLAKELTIANDEQYRAVLVHHPKTKLLTKIKANRITTCLHLSHIGLWLLRDIDEALQGIDTTIVVGKEANGLEIPKKVLSQCMWHAFQWERVDSLEYYKVPSFLEVLGWVETNDTTLAAPFIKSMRQHFRSMAKQHRPMMITKRVDRKMALKLVHCLTVTFLMSLIDHFFTKFDRFVPLIAESTSNLFPGHLETLCKLCHGTGSDLSNAFADLITPIWGNSREFHQFVLERKRIIDRFRKIAAEIRMIATKLEYYWSVGIFLAGQRNSSKGGKVAVICDKELLSPEWLRMIPQILKQNMSSVSVRQF